MPMMNHGVLEISNYGTKPKKLVLSSTLNVIIRVPSLSFVPNPPTSRMMAYLPGSDRLKFLLKAE